MKYSHIIDYVYGQPWAILPEKLAVITDLLRFRAEGGTLTEAEIQERVGAVSRPMGGRSGAVAVIPVFGIISQRMTLMSAMSGGTSTEQLAGAFRQVMADDTVGAVVLDVHSPGGSVYGIDELTSEIYAARGRKPIVAVANSLMASAAYYIASAADEIAVTPGGEVGSIGVIAAHEDHSAELEARGIRVSLITAGRFKAEAAPFQPLSEEARAAMQSMVNDYYGMFIAAVARGRGVSTAKVRADFGEGRTVRAKDAVRLGMADRVATLEQTISRLARGGSVGRAAALAERGELDSPSSDSTAGTLDYRRRRFRMHTH